MKTIKHLPWGLCAVLLALLDVYPITATDNLAATIPPTEYVPTVYHPSNSNGPLVQAGKNNVLSAIFTGIQESEYEINWQAGVAAFQSPNRAHNLRFTYLPTGFTVQRRAPVAATDWWSAGIFLAGVGENKNFQPNAAAKLNPLKKKASIKHGSVSIEYENQSQGMRQNFIVDQKPNAKIGLALFLTVQAGGVTMSVNEQGTSVSFANLVTGNIEMTYGDLKVWDAQNTILSARFMPVSENEFAIGIDDARAVYPVTIDPITTTPYWDLSQNDSGCKFGFSVAQHHVNDITKVGLIIGAPYFDNGQTDEGKVFVYYENESSGLSTSPDWTAESNQAGAMFGWSVAGLDADYDTIYTDVAIGAPGYDYYGYDKGAVFIYYGSELGLGSDGTPGNADWAQYGEQANEQFGYSVTGVHNIKGDNYDSLAVGAPYYNAPGGNPYYIGKAYVYYGNGSSINTSVDRTYTGTQTGMDLGWSVADAGDVEYDGYGDLIVGAPGYNTGAGVVFIYHGDSSGLPASATYTLSSPQSGCRFGTCVASAGFVNNDDYADVVVGAPNYDDDGKTDCGGALVYHGSSTGISTSSSWFKVGNQNYEKFGWSVASTSGFDEVPYSGVIVGIPYLDYGGNTDAGRVAFWQGSETGITTGDPFYETSDVEPNYLMGYSVCGFQNCYFHGIVAGLPGNKEVAVFMEYTP